MLYIYIYIHYIGRERERERGMCILIHLCVYTYVYTYVYTWLPYSTLLANSVKWLFPFQVYKISPKQPQTYFRGG